MRNIVREAALRCTLRAAKRHIVAQGICASGDDGIARSSSEWLKEACMTQRKLRPRRRQSVRRARSEEGEAQEGKQDEMRKFI